MIKTGKTAVIGDKDGSLAFKAVGFDVFTAYNGEQTNDILRKLVKEDYAVIFVSDNLCAEIPDTLIKLKTRPYPAVIPIPDAKGANGFALRSMRHDVEKAIGADIIFNKD